MRSILWVGLGVFGILCCAAGQLVAGTSPIDYVSNPPLLHEVKGTQFSGSPTVTGTFDLTPGVVQNCKLNLPDNWIVFHCAVSPNAVLTLHGPVSDASYPFDEEWIFLKPQENGDTLWEYVLNGSWSGDVNGTPISTKTKAIVWAYASQPDHVKGSFGLIDEGAGVTLDGAQNYPALLDSAQ